jgi:hypothetical protein
MKLGTQMPAGERGKPIDIEDRNDNWKSSQEAKSISTKTVFNLTISIT